MRLGTRVNGQIDWRDYIINHFLECPINQQFKSPCKQSNQPGGSASAYFNWYRSKYDTTHNYRSEIYLNAHRCLIDYKR